MLAREGIRVSNKRVSALMRELGLESVRVDAKKQYKMREKYVQQNLLQRNFKTSKPNQVWVSDITCFKVKGKWIYVCVISVTKYIDFYNNIRPHETNHYRTPAEMENELSDSLQGEVE